MHGCYAVDARQRALCGCESNGLRLKQVTVLLAQVLQAAAKRGAQICEKLHAPPAQAQAARAAEEVAR